MGQEIPLTPSVAITTTDDESVDLTEVLELVERIHEQTALFVHDGIGQSLTGAALLTQALYIDLCADAQNEGNASLAQSINGHLAMTLEQVRALSQTCAPTARSHRSLAETLEDFRLLIPVHRRSDLVFRIDPMPQGVGADRILSIRRVCSMALRAMLIWAPTASLTLTIQCSGRRLLIVLISHEMPLKLYEHIRSSLDLRLLKLAAKKIDSAPNFTWDASGDAAFTISADL